MAEDRTKSAAARNRFLSLAVLLLIAGETVFKGKLSPAGFLFFWLFCFALTAAAIITAFADAKAVTRETVSEQRDLLNDTIKSIQSDAARDRTKAQNGEDN